MVATVNVYFRDGGRQTVTGLDPHQVGELAQLISAREQETFTLVGLRTFTISEHRTADVVRMEVLPEEPS
jgi:hypothetical protein